MPDFIRSWMKLHESAGRATRFRRRRRPAPFDVAGEKVAVTICYEDVFGAEQLRSLPDATLLVNVKQRRLVRRLDRAAPAFADRARARRGGGRYMLRSTNTGVTAVIDNRGGVVETLPQFHVGLLKQTVRG